MFGNLRKPAPHVFDSFSLIQVPEPDNSGALYHSRDVWAPLACNSSSFPA